MHTTCPSCKRDLEVSDDFKGYGTCNYCQARIEIVDGSARSVQKYRRQHRCENCDAFFVSFNPDHVQCDACIVKEKSKRLEKTVQAEWTRLQMDKRSRTDKSLYVLAVVAVFWILSLPLVRLTQLLEPIRRQVATETLSIEGDFRPGGYFDVHFTGKPVPALLGKHKIRMLIEPAPTETDWRIAEYGASGRWERLTEYRPGASYRAMTVVNVVPVYTPPICYRIPRNEVYGKEIVLQILVEVDYPTPVRNGFQIQTDRFSSAEKIVLRPDAGTVVPFFQRDPALMEPRWLGLLVFIAWFLGVVLAIGMGISISLDPPALKRLHQTR